MTASSNNERSLGRPARKRITTSNPSPDKVFMFPPLLSFQACVPVYRKNVRFDKVRTVNLLEALKTLSPWTARTMKADWHCNVKGKICGFMR